MGKIILLAPPVQPDQLPQLEFIPRSCDCTAKILIVDDTSFNVMTLKLLIKDKYDMDADEAVNGKIGVEMFKKGLDKPCGCPDRAYKLIFMDLQMPVMEGKEASRKILSMQAELGQELTRIIVLTAFSNLNTLQECKAIGVK